MGRREQGTQNRRRLSRPLDRGTLSQTPIQTPGTTGLAQVLPPPSPATLGQQILSFARQKLGRKVGDGECFALADKALRAAGAATAEDFCTIGPNTDYVWSSQAVSIGTAQPGDILQVRTFSVVRRTDRPDGSWNEERSSRGSPNHTAVIASTRTEGGIVFLTILEQNVTIGGTRNQPKKSVRQNEIPTSDGEIKNGNDTITYTVTGDLWIYRPVARSP
jgi:hypothetical protein